MLHVLAGSTVVDHSTTSKANIASLLQGGGSVGAEASVQSRQGRLPSLIGIDAQEDAAPTVNEVKIYLNTWRSTDYLMITPEQLTHRFGPVPYSQLVGAPIPLELEADWTVEYESTGAVDQMVALLMSYGNVIPPKGGNLIHRKGAVTAADYSTTGAFGTAVDITDLNPEKTYRVWGLFGNGGTDCGILRLKAPSFNGQVIQALIPQGHWGGYYFPYDSMLINGVETLSVDASGGAASACEYHIMLEEYGDFKAGGATSGLKQGPRGSAKDLITGLMRA